MLNANTICSLPPVRSRAAATRGNDNRRMRAWPAAKGEASARIAVQRGAGIMRIINQKGCRPAIPHGRSRVVMIQDEI